MLLTAILLRAVVFAQEKNAPLPAPEQEPPEEEDTLKAKEYSLNPLKASENITAGNFYFKKGNFGAARSRYREATRWDPGSAEAFRKLGEADEKVRDFNEARESYTKYLELAPEARDAAAVKKRIAALPKSGKK